jgi:DNA-binding transcriptional regulator YiaG
MTPLQAIRHWGSQIVLAETLGIDRRVVNNWKRRRHIPLKWQVELEHMSKGQLAMDAPWNRKGNGA